MLDLEKELVYNVPVTTQQRDTEAKATETKKNKKVSKSA